MLNVFGISGSALTAHDYRGEVNAGTFIGDYSGRMEKKTSVKWAGDDKKFTMQSTSQVVDSAAPLRMTYDPKNPAADDKGYVAMPNVNVVDEMVNMISASRSYQINAEVMSAAKSLMLKTLAIGQQ
ncbi:MAG: flagellar basal body rod protein FlgC [Rhodocyclales bacterium]|nr:flagellar basal body rod protein FlgC [Rhodocyclales bacterium]